MYVYVYIYIYICGTFGAASIPENVSEIRGARVRPSNETCESTPLRLMMA